jgi:hypothetical protein
VRNYGEFGLVMELARKADIPVYSWEIPIEKDVQKMLKKFSPEQVSLFYILRPYFSNLRFGKPASPEEYIAEYIVKRTNYPGLQGTIKDVKDIDRIWARDFKGLPDWRETSDEYGLPGYLKDISEASNLSRNEHLACVIISLVEKGERVYVIGGSSHPVCVEPALKASL